ncbi:MAG: serine hydrolase [Pseudomonadota bacterium]
MMNTFPPSPDAQVTLANWRTQPFNRWAFHHVREIVPSAEIVNDPANVWALPEAPREIDLGDAVTGMANDALVILHEGRIVHESYRGGMGSADPHILMSVSKSMLGLVAGTCIARGEVAAEDLITDHLPELADTAYAGATVRDALDMRVGVAFDEDYTATDGPILAYRQAANWNPVPAGADPHDLRSFQSLLTQPDGPHSGRFHYVSPVTDMLAWLLERASGLRYADLVSQRLLAPLGAERPGYITVDRKGGARGAGGMCLTARDLARVGLLMLQGGARDGVQILPADWVADILSGGDRDAWDQGDFADKFPDLDISYRSKWYIHHGDDPLVHGMGIHGQYLFVDPKRQLSIAWFSSEDSPTDPGCMGHVFASVQRIRAAFG